MPNSCLEGAQWTTCPFELSCESLAPGRAYAGPVPLWHIMAHGLTEGRIHG
jgi:hypothetical protein